MKLILLILASILPSYLYGGEKNEKLTFENIPPVLLVNADAVIRNYEQEIRIISPSEVKHIEHYTITILNKNAAHYANVIKPYNKLFEHIDDIKGFLYDKHGSLVKRMNKLDIEDNAIYTNRLQFDDYRSKVGHFFYADYPFTVSFDIESTINQTFSLPVFNPQKTSQIAVEQAKLTLIYPENLKVRYKTFQIPKSANEVVNDGINTMTISVEKLIAKKKIVLEENNSFSKPTVLIACSDFTFGGKSGKMTTWQEFGKFIYDLNADRLGLTPELKIKVHELADTCTDTLSKIKILYNYLQKNTRYVAVELGIGGLQCLDAEFVSINKYGDCKGLSNFMSAMLKEVGIKSYGVIVYGKNENDKKMQSDFVCNTFNHYILCVPRYNDAVWLECTSKTLPAGYLSSFTANRNAILLTENGGYIVKTPIYAEKENYSTRIVNFRLNRNDSAEVHLMLTYKAAQQVDEAFYVTDRSKSEIEAYFNNKFSFGGTKINNFQISKSLNGYLPVLTENISLNGKAGVMNSGNRKFIDIPFPPLTLQGRTDPEKRDVPFEFISSYTVSDTIFISLESNYKLEKLPQSIDLQYVFGSYLCKYYSEGADKIIIVRTYTQKEGVYDAQLYSDYRAMIKKNDIKTDKLVFIKLD